MAMPLHLLRIGSREEEKANFVEFSYEQMFELVARRAMKKGRSTRLRPVELTSAGGTSLKEEGRSLIGTLTPDVRLAKP